MNVFENLNDLRHNNNLFDDFFKNVWNFYKSFFMGDYRNWSLLVSVNNLQDFFNVVDISDNFLEFFHDDCFFNDSFDFLYSFILVFNFDNLLVFSDNFLDLFDNNWNFDNFFDNFFNVSIDVDQLWNNPLNFNNFGNLNNDFLCSFNLLDFWNSDCSLNYFFNYLLSSYDLLNN